MKIISIFFFLLMTTSFSWVFGASSLLLEPSIGFRSESVALTDLSRIESRLKANTPVYGLNLGYRSPIGVDVNLGYNYSSGKAEFGSYIEKSSFSHQTASTQLGINALGLMKIYLGFAFSNELKIEGTSQYKGFKLSGPAYLVGLQFKVIPFLNLGAQYNLNQFNKITGSAYNSGEAIEKYFSKVDSQDYSLYLSFAF